MALLPSVIILSCSVSSALIGCSAFEPVSVYPMMSSSSDFISKCPEESLRHPVSLSDR